MTLLPGPPAPESRRPGARGRGAHRCSFCGKAQEDVRRLIAGPNLIFICDDCIGLCNRILTAEEGRAAGAPPAAEDALPGDG